MPAAPVFVGSALVTISFDLASTRDYIFDRNSFYVLLQKFRFRAVIFKVEFVCLFPRGCKSF